MGFSYSALEHMTEMAAARDPGLRRAAGKAGRPSRARGRTMKDAELVARLGAFGVSVDRVWLDRQSRTHGSAEEIAAVLNAGMPDRGQEEDWLWVGLAVLWERWFPDRPNLEMLDDKMQRGYLRQEARDDAGAARFWLDAWRDVLALADKLDLYSIEAFDEWFRGTQCLFNWVQDFTQTLWNAGLDDRAFWRERVAFCQSLLDRFTVDCDMTRENMRRDTAETYAALGDRDRADALFREWLEADPQWGWGWIGWASSYSMAVPGPEAPEVAERILRQGLAVPGVRDREDLLEQLADVCDGDGAEADAAEVAHSLEVSSSGLAAKLKTKVTFGGDGLPLDELPRLAAQMRSAQDAALRSAFAEGRGAPSPTPKQAGRIGRNAPCPCGSGRKYKKCCGQA